MKVRKLAVALALAGGLGSGVAQALGLGEIELQSYLNEPLDAEINLRKSQGVDAGDVLVNIASESDYQRVGIDRNLFLTKLQFEVTTTRDGSLVVNVSSREPLREPYLNFLMEVTWPSGRLMREYAVLVDPPVYAEESGVQERVAAPVTRSEPAQQPTRQARSPARADVGSSARTMSGNRTFGPTSATDTLWKIAADARPDSSVSMQQVMLAIQDLNPDAFMGNNINRLKRGEVLRLPELDQIRSRSAAEANRQVAAQNEALSGANRTVDATESSQPTGGAGAAQGEGGDELRLIAAEETESRSAEEGGSAGGDGQSAGGVDAGSAVAMEELESARRENDELNTRVEDLQDQVETLQRLLELKDSQLADMQQMSGSEGAANDAQPQDTETVDPQQMPDDAVASSDGDADAAESDSSESASPEVDASAQADAEPDGEGNQNVEASLEDESDAEVATAEDAESSDGEQVADAEADNEMAEQPVAESETGTATEEDQAQSEPVASQPESQQPAQQPDKGFPGNVIDAITNNPMYQIALGGGLVLLLLLLLLLARRNANREKEFYEQLNSETDEGHDTFDLSLDDETGTSETADEPMAEADTYIAYGQLDKAAESLEAAISREPSRTDLRLKLLGVYADTQDRGSFDKQFHEIEALEDDQAIQEAEELRARLEESEAMPSIDDLESQLRSDSFAPSNEVQADRSSEAPAETRETADEFDGFGDDFSELELDDNDLASEEAKPQSSTSDMIEYDLSDMDFGESELPENENAEAKPDTSEGVEDDLSFDFDDLETGSGPEAETAGSESASSEAFSLDDFEDLESETESPVEDRTSTEMPDEAGTTNEAAEVDDTFGELDESFLDELDAELDKVAEESPEKPDAEDGSSLDDLELDVSDEDLALMEEFADSGNSANPDTEAPASSLDEELDLEDALADDRAESPEELTSEAEDLEGLEESGLLDETAEPPVASDTLDRNDRQSALDDIDESDLGDDDDFDFLAGTDEAATKLDLARAYIEMGDMDGARDILEEVALEGDDEQKAEAQDLLKNLS